MGLRRLTLAATGMLFSMSGCAGGASDAATAPERPPTPIRTEILEPQPLQQALVVPGIVEPDSRIALGFRIDGFVARFAVDEGDRVERGAVIAELDLDDLQREVRLARVSLERAQVQEAEAKLAFERQQELSASRNTSQQAFDQARLAFEAAQSGARNAALQLEAADDRLTKGTLRAPVTGYVERRHREPHELARAGEPMVTLTVLDPVTIRAAVADTAVARLRVGGPALVTSQAWPAREFAGEIARIDVSADPATRTCPFEVAVPNADLALRPELVVEVRVPEGDAEPTLTVPLASVLRDAAGEPFCFVIPRPGAPCARRPVQLGAVHGKRVAVARGLQPGEQVVVRGQHFLSDGDPVRIVTD